MQENASLLVDILTLLGAFFLGFIAGAAYASLRRSVVRLRTTPGRLSKSARNVGERFRRAFTAPSSSESTDRTSWTGQIAGSVADILTLRVRHAEASFREGLTAFDRGDYGLARTRFSRALLWDRRQELHPLHLQAHLHLGWLDEERGALNKAKQHYWQAVHLDADNLVATVRMGAIHFRLEETGKAIFQFQRALELDPTNLDTHYRLYAIYRQAGMLREALQQLRTIKTGEDTNTLLGLFARHGKDNFRLGHYAEAANDYQLALQIAPNSIPLYAALGDLYHLQQRPRAALETWCRGLWIDHSDALGERLITVAKQVSDTWPTINLVRDCVARHRRDSRYHFLLARLLRQANQDDESLTELEETVRLDPQLTDAHQLLGDLYARAGRVTIASATYRAGLKAAAAQETVYRCRACAHVTREEQERCFQCNRWDTLERMTQEEAEARASFPRNLLAPHSVARSLTALWNRVAGQLSSGD